MTSYVRKDRFYQKAKKEGYPSRSAYKLIEINRRFGILKPGAKIVDPGSAPGGWLKVAEEKMKASKVEGQKSKGVQIVGIDLLPLQYQPGKNVTFIPGDFTDPANQQKVYDALEGKADWVLSDLSPNLSGIRFRDTGASAELCDTALNFASRVLRGGGGLVVKIFPGVELGEFKKKLKKNFSRVSTFIPEATRKTSTEIYLVGSGFHPRG